MPLDTVPVARTELIALSEAVAAATLGRDEAQAALSRLERPAQLLEEAKAAYAAEKAAHDARLLEWYSSGCIGERPVTPPSLLLAEHRLGEAHRDIGASAGVLETARKALDEANIRLGSLAAQKQSAHYRVAVEEARAVLRGRATPAMIASLVELLPVVALAGELRVTGKPEAISASRAIDQLISEAKQSVAVKGGGQSARSFLRELDGDPHAHLLSPQGDDIEIVEVEARTIKPLPDGSQFLNRGEREVDPEIGVSTPFYRTGWEAALSAAGERNASGGSDAVQVVYAPSAVLPEAGDRIVATIVGAG